MAKSGVHINTGKLDIIFADLQKMFKPGYGARAGYLTDTQSENGNIKIHEIAAIQTYGAPELNIPKRSFMQNAHKKAKRALRKQVNADIQDGREMEQICKRAGVRIREIIHDEISKGSFKANASITVDGGWMRNKISGKRFYVEGKGVNAPLKADRNTSELMDALHSEAIISHKGTGPEKGKD